MAEALRSWRALLLDGARLADETTDSAVSDVTIKANRNLGSCGSELYEVTRNDSLRATYGMKEGCRHVPITAVTARRHWLGGISSIKPQSSLSVDKPLPHAGNI